MRGVWLLSILLPAQVIGQTAGDTTSLAKTVSMAERFPVGEKLVYDAKAFGFIKLGRASMEVLPPDTVRSEATWHFRFLLDANLVGVYRMHDVFDSWVGVDDFHSRRYIQRKNEGGKQWTDEYEIYPDSGIYWQNGVDTAQTASANPIDDTAFFYFVRTVDLVPGDSLAFNNYFRPDRNPVIVKVLARDTIDVPAGRFATIVIQPIIKGGMFDGNNNGRMWLTDDDRRLIVQMKTKIGFGVITMRLTDYIDPREETAEAARRPEK
ncbi:MAG: DUF3108 domain-containing protein [Gemmatimonadetes bacterium]|nr:DUF3108 domain-containing protein [Gemmatimonadota bacterium]